MSDIAPSPRKDPAAFTAAAVGAATLLLGLSAGGFFPAATGVATAAFLVLAAVWLAAAPSPLAGLGGASLALVGGFAGLAALSLASASWSDAPARALLEHDKALLYTAVALVCALPARTAGTLRALLRGACAGLTAIALVGLAARLLPEVVGTDPSLVPERLSWPLTYWNGMGLAAGLALLMAVGLSSDPQERRVVRLAAAAVVPALAATLVLTYARGPIALTAAGLALLVLTTRTTGTVGTFVACAPPTALALVVTLGSDVLTSAEFRTAAGVEEGRRVLLVLAGCVAWAVAGRALALRAGRARAVQRVARVVGRPRVVGAAGVAVALVVAAGVAVAVASGTVERQWDRFLAAAPLAYDDPRDRLLDPGNNGRLALWETALDGFEAQPLRGSGAGTFALTWDRERDVGFESQDAHSVYLETLSELGIAGGLLLAIALLAATAGLARRARGPDRAAAGTLLACALVWLVHAGVDWDWELPAVTLWLPAAGAAALARPAGARPARLGRGGRVIAALACLVLAVTPVRVALSQSRLDAGVDALRRGDCATAQREALRSLDAVGARSEPWELVGYCAARAGDFDVAILALEEATRLEPGSWDPWYGLALVRATGGRDPRPALREAVRRNPRDVRVQEAAQRLSGDSPRRWRAAGRALPLPVPPAP